METSYWSLADTVDTEKKLKRLAGGKIYSKIKEQTRNKTVKWSLVDCFPERTRLLRKIRFYICVFVNYCFVKMYYRYA